jgi:hypothetical protein
MIGCALCKSGNLLVISSFAGMTDKENNKENGSDDDQLQINFFEFMPGSHDLYVFCRTKIDKFERAGNSK